MKDVFAWVVSLLGLAFCFATVDLLRVKAMIGPRASRKATHIGAGSIHCKVLAGVLVCQD